MAKANILAVILFVNGLIGYSSQNELKVDTTSGEVLGFEIKTVNGDGVSGFLGIPFAEAPIGNLRFKPPVPVSKSDNVIKATDRSKACLQLLSATLDESNKEMAKEWVPDDSDTSEDCLYLNVWVPNPRPKNAPVMVWIHGGGYEAGTANSLIYDGQFLAAKGVIVVSMNYRLSVFGFLVLDPEEAPGNVGLMDQTLALKWVQDNIANFGGSPDRVTIFGESAGAGSVGHHLLLPSSKGLFQRAVLESGAATSVWSYTDKKTASLRAGIVVEALECLSTTPKDMVHCLREKDAMEVVEKVKGLAASKSHLLNFVPTVDGVYYPDDPNKLLATLQFDKLDILMGASIDDGVFVPVFSKVLPISEEPPLVEEEKFTAYLKEFFGNDSLLLELVKFQYTDWEGEGPSENWRRGLMEFSNDVFFKCSMTALADAATFNGNRVYFYQFEHRSNFRNMPDWIGASHAEEIPFVFGLPYVRTDKFKPEDVAFSDRVMNYWTEFAKKGDPNNEVNKHQWPLYSTNKEVLRLDLSESIQRGMRQRNCAFFNNLLPKLLMAKKQAESKA